MRRKPALAASWGVQVEQNEKCCGENATPLAGAAFTCAYSYGKIGQAQEGLILLAEALETVVRTGERYYEAKIHRLQGELLQGAEMLISCFLVALP